MVARSRWLTAMVAIMGLLLFAVGATLAAYPFISLSGAQRLMAGSVCAGLSLLLFKHTAASGKTFRLDISGLGQFRLSEYSEVKRGVTQKTPCEEEGRLVRLLENSVFWPHLMVLRLEDASGRVRVLLILQDCTGAEEFRALQVACRAMARRPSPFT